LQGLGGRVFGLYAKIWRSRGLFRALGEAIAAPAFMQSLMSGVPAVSARMISIPAHG